MFVRGQSMQKEDGEQMFNIIFHWRQIGESAKRKASNLLQKVVRRLFSK
jgi:hypothetical protein